MDCINTQYLYEAKAAAKPNVTFWTAVYEPFIVVQHWLPIVIMPKEEDEYQEPSSSIISIEANEQTSVRGIRLSCMAYIPTLEVNVPCESDEEAFLIKNDLADVKYVPKLLHLNCRTWGDFLTRAFKSDGPDTNAIELEYTNPTISVIKRIMAMPSVNQKGPIKFLTETIAFTSTGDLDKPPYIRKGISSLYKWNKTVAFADHIPSRETYEEFVQLPSLTVDEVKARIKRGELELERNNIAWEDSNWHKIFD